ncbi:MAG: FKBP-type peptidyl-prolyl cis-trans isomerase [Muribaculum sp.]|nr:FKBP-type peptidyl-prolyl cis-trans isomerase [Muribaculum sp.]
MKKCVYFAAAAFMGLSLMASCSGKKGQTDTIVEENDQTLIVNETDTVVKTINDTIRESLPAPEFFTNAANKGNGQDSTYVETPSGLKYMVVKKGTGKSPKATDTVTVNYLGELINGTVFDSSYERGEPISFPLNGVIKGWTEGLQTMREGGTTIFYIPADLAYGEQGTPGGPVPPNAPLIFIVDLISVQSQPAQ